MMDAGRHRAAICNRTGDTMKNAVRMIARTVDIPQCVGICVALYRASERGRLRRIQTCLRHALFGRKQAAHAQSPKKREKSTVELSDGAFAQALFSLQHTLLWCRVRGNCWRDLRFLGQPYAPDPAIQTSPLLRSRVRVKFFLCAKRLKQRQMAICTLA